MSVRGGILSAMSGRDASDPLAGPAAGEAVPEPLHVGYRRGSASLWQAGGLCAVAAAVTAALITYVPGGNPVALCGAVVSGLLFVVLAVVTGRAVWRAVRNRPLLTLDGSGVTLHSARVSLRWIDVAEVRVVTRPDGVRTVVFVAEDADLALGRLQGLAFWFAVNGIDRVGGPVFVRAHDLAIELEPLLTAVHRYAAVPIKQRYTTS